ncbi:hypothetical protein OH77DRAFT_1518672 [Trametes cingulata]|nr:hypothetical protein OH77DRAFT_1518672 [Trametes cingulata]
MAESIRSPWILDYLISVAEQYGGNMVAVPRSEKPWRAQLVKFLTFGPPGSTDPCVIWADVSDKKHIIHARLSIDAIERYSKDPRHAGRSITSYKSALVRLSRVRPAFGRVARHESGGGMTDHPRLFLDVDEIDVLGSFGEATWGAPVDIGQDPNIREWMMGLQHGGGGGNVLKLRKERALAQAAEHADQLKARANEPQQQPTLDSMDLKVRVARKSAAHRARPSTDGAAQRPIASKEAVRRASWKRLHTNMMKYFRPPDDVYEQLMQLCGVKEEKMPEPARAATPVQQKVARSRSDSRMSERHSAKSPSPSPRKTPSPSRTNLSSPAHTPSHWSPSVRGSVPPWGASNAPADHHSSSSSSSETEEEPEDDTFMDDTRSSSATPEQHSRAASPEVPMDVEDASPEEPKESSGHSIPMPPPAQPRPQAPPPSSMMTVPYASSPPRDPSPATKHRPSRSRDLDMDTLPPSSFPASTYPYQLPPSPTSSPRHPNLAPTPASAYPKLMPAVRRVPLPQCNPLRRDPDASGEGRVLVENSDTASPGSQRFAGSQSQSQSQSQSGSSGSSQSQGRSQGRSQGESQEQQRHSQLRNELEIPEHQPEEPVSQNVPDGSKLVEGAGESQESQEHPAGRSQQSLSYKGDSQSQENQGDGQPPASQQDPGTESQQPAQGTRQPEEDARAEMSTEVPNGEAARPQQEDRPAPDAESANGAQADPDEPSPMAVDPDSDPTDSPAESKAPARSAPGWAAIPAQDDSEGEDSSTEVDELLSDPLIASAAALPVPGMGGQGEQGGKGRSGENGGKRREARLEPDDERTAAMVEEYMAKVQKVIRRRHQLEAGTDEKAQVEERRATNDERELEKQDMARPDAERRDDPAKAPTATVAHDPAIWAAPTFMQKATAKQVSKPGQTRPAPAPVKEKVKVEQQSPIAPPRPLPDTRGKKRAASPSSLSPEREPSPAKKRKTSIAAVPIRPPADPVVSSTRREQPARPAPPAAVSKPSMQRRESTASSHSAAPSSTAVEPRASVGPTAAGGGSRGVKYVDLRAASRSSSRASSRPPRVPEEGSSRTARPVEGRASTAAKGKAVARDAKPSSAAPKSSAPKGASAGTLPLTSKASTSGTTASSFTRSSKGTTSSLTPVEAAQGGPSRAADALLSELSLELTRTPDGPPLLTWQELVDILLETGRARHKMQSKR